MSPPTGFKTLPLSISQLSLAAVLKCGQSFRWTAYPLPVPDFLEGKKEDEIPSQPLHEYRFVLKDRVVCLRQDSEALYYRSVFPETKDTSVKHLGVSIEGREGENAKVDGERIDIEREEETLAFLKDYFQLDVDLVRLYSDWAERDPVFRNSVKERFAGIRMLRQDPWENVVSFICSSNNHIGRITKMVQSLCSTFSPVLCKLPPPDASGTDPTTFIAYHSFPTPNQLRDPSVASKLRELGFGYRAEYVQRTAEMLCEEHDDPEAWLLSLREKGVQEAREELLKLCGVGPKVADCVLLMSMDKKNVVPVDTHVHQIALKYYGLRGTPQGKGGKVPMTPKIYEAVGKRLVEIWGDYAGWAHSVLFTADLRSFATYGLPTKDTLTPRTSPKKGSTIQLPSDSGTVTPESILPTSSESGTDYFGTPKIGSSLGKRRSRRLDTPSKLKRARTE